MLCAEGRAECQLVNDDSLSGQDSSILHQTIPMGLLLKLWVQCHDLRGISDTLQVYVKLPYMSPFFRGRQKRVLINFPWPAGTSLILSCVCNQSCGSQWVRMGRVRFSLARFLCDNTVLRKITYFAPRKGPFTTWRSFLFTQPSAQQLSDPLTCWDSTLIITYQYIVNLQFGYTDCTPGPNSGPEIPSSSLRHFDYMTSQLDSFSIHIVLCILNDH
jgi:hypothetical protein